MESQHDLARYHHFTQHIITSLNHNTLLILLHTTTTHCWYHFTQTQHTVDITSHNHNTIYITSHNPWQMQEKTSVRKFLHNCPNTISTFCKIWCNGYTDVDSCKTHKKQCVVTEKYAFIHMMLQITIKYMLCIKADHTSNLWPSAWRML